MSTHTEAVLTSTHNLCFEQKYEKYESFLSENFQFLEVKFFIHLNRPVFVMHVCVVGFSSCWGIKLIFWPKNPNNYPKLSPQLLYYLEIWA